MRTPTRTSLKCRRCTKRWASLLRRPRSTSGRDRELVEVLKRFPAAGAEEAPTLRLFRIYADSARRIAKAEAELYEVQIEWLRRSGRNERELLEFGGDSATR